MRRLPTLVLFAALLPSAAWFPSAQAQASRPAASLTHVERKAVDLREGMTPDEVLKLLGKPRRTALRGDDGSSNARSQGTLQWTYVLAGAAYASERSLQVEFAAKGADQWSVNAWGWSGY